MLTDRGRFSPAEVLEILEPVCSALQAAHEQGIVHRDLKASNILIMNQAGKRVVKLLDFGIAKLMHPDASEAGLTVVGTRLGTSYTMAPEQIRGDAVDPRTDIYALGVLMYHMLTGRVPFRGFTQQETDRLILESPVPRPSQSVSVSKTVDAVVLRCMDKNPADRYQSARAVAIALRAAVMGEPAEPTRAAAPRRAVAIHVDARTSPSADEGDDALLDDLTSVLDTAEQSLQKAGFAILLQTGTTLLGARVLSEDDAVARGEIDAARAEARALLQTIADRDAAHTDLEVELRLHVDTAVVRGAASSPAISGSVVDVSSWPADTLMHASNESS
jgi:serine/threonine-protein kinase